jgi:hypothetical protein
MMCHRRPLFAQFTCHHRTVPENYCRIWVYLSEAGAGLVLLDTLKLDTCQKPFSGWIPEYY